MMSNIDISYGVCVNNNDPHNSSRIRFYLLSDLTNRNITIKDITTLLNNKDSASNYTPWEITNSSNVKDPYLADSFLPKNINTIPNKGQLVKLIKYNDTPIRYEYVGPITNDMVNLQQGYVVSKNRTFNNDNDVNKITPPIDKVTISGKKNEQILLGNDEIINRVKYLDNNNRLNNYPFNQLVKYPVNFDTNKESVTTIESVEYLIDFVLVTNFIYEKKLSTDHKNFKVIIKIYDGSKYTNANGIRGIKNTNIDFKSEFQDKLKGSVIDIEVSTFSYNTLVDITNTIFVNFKNRKLYQFPKNNETSSFTNTNNEFDITINNKYSFNPNDGGVIPDIKNEIIVDNFAILIDKDQINYDILNSNETFNNFGISEKDYLNNPTSLSGLQWLNYSKLRTFISNGDYQQLVTNLKNTNKQVTKETDVFSSLNESISYNVINVDNILLYSTILDNSLVSDKVGIEAADQTTLTKLFKKNDFTVTHPSVRGDKIIKLLIKVVDILNNHGHVTGVEFPDSLDGSTRDELSKLKEELEKELINDKSKGLLNHHIRIN